MIKKLLIIILLIGATSLSLAYRTGGMSPSDFIDASPDKQTSNLQVAHPETLIKQAEHALEQNNTDLAKELTLKALSKNITNGLAFAELVDINNKKGIKDADTEKIAQLAESLWPAHIGVPARRPGSSRPVPAGSASATGSGWSGSAAAGHGRVM